MKKFVLVGDIEFIGSTAHVRRVAYGAYASEEEIRVLDSIGYYDYILPHYFKGHIVFEQYHKEDWHIEERQQAIQDEYREDELRERAERKEEFGY